jgi:hypothetical protein
MKWYNLKNNKCPKCSSYLKEDEHSLLLVCSKPECDFKISSERFTELSNTYVEKYNRRDQYQANDGWGRFD